MGPSAVARYGKDHYRITAWALDCAERVLPIFEAHRPGDFRPRRAVDIGRAWLRGEISMIDARSFAFPAHAAAREATDPAAVAAARAACTPSHSPTPRASSDGILWGDASPGSRDPERGCGPGRLAQ